MSNIVTPGATLCMPRDADRIDDDGQVQDKASDRNGYPPPPLQALVSHDWSRGSGDVPSGDWPGLKVLPNTRS